MKIDELTKYVNDSHLVPTTDGCTVYNFKDKKTAEAFSEFLEGIGIVGRAGKKFVAQHISGNSEFGVVLTKDNIKVLKSAVAKGMAVENKEELGVLVNNLKKGLESFYMGYYRNTGPCLKNLASALEVFSETGDLNAEIVPAQAHGQGSSTQTNIVKTTFLNALDKNDHGGIQQSIAAMNKEGQYLDIVASVEKILAFIKELNIKD